MVRGGKGDEGEGFLAGWTTPGKVYRALEIPTVRHLADVLLLRDLVEDLPAVRAACVEVFAFRGNHGWPPAFEPPAFWEDLYAELAAGLELARTTLEDAVPEALAFIGVIDAAGAQ